MQQASIAADLPAYAVYILTEPRTRHTQTTGPLCY